MRFVCDTARRDVKAGAAVLLAVLLSACQSTTPAPLPQYQLIPGPTGVAVLGSGGKEIGFGRDRAGVITTVQRITGAVGEARPCPEPGLDAIVFGNLTLVFDAKRLVGAATPEQSAGARCPTGAS